MNEVFAKNSKYGELVYDEILLEYDGPCIFSVKNKLGYRFVCLLETENEQMDRYLVVPVSLERYNAFIRNNWSIRNMFVRPELGGVFSVTFSCGEEIVQEHSPSEINEMNLPDPEEMLEFNGGYTREEILVDSEEKRVPVFQKSLEKNGTHRQFIFADELAKESKRFQDVFNGIAQDAISKIPIEQKNRRESMKQAARIPYYATYPASFGMQIEGLEPPLLDGRESEFTKFVRTFFELVDFENEQKEEFFGEHQNALNALRAYYKTLLSLGFSVKMKAATPQHLFLRRDLSQSEINSRYRYLSNIITHNSEQMVLVGTWTQISYETKTFQFKSNEGKVIKGKFDDDFDESVFDFEKEIKIHLEKQKQVDRTRKEKETYTLLFIEEG